MIDAAQKLSGLGFGSLAVVIIVGSYYGIWVWGSQMRAREAEYERRLQKAEANAERWQAAYERTIGMAETAVGRIPRGSEP